MKSNEPVSHHFVPQFILENFRDENDEIHSFNKIFWKMNKPTKSTKYILSENHLHTLIHGTNEFYEIETFYSSLEDNFSRVLKSIKEAIQQGEDIRGLSGSLEIVKIIGFFVSLSFWRLPSASIQARSARKNLRKIYDNAGDENKKILGRDRKFIRDLERMGGNVSEKICQFVAIPALTANLEHSNLSKIWFHETDFDLVISDRPVVCKTNENFKLNGAFYMPITPRLCLTNQPESIRDFNIQIFLNAEKIAIGCSQNALEKSASDCQAISS